MRTNSVVCLRPSSRTRPTFVRRALERELAEAAPQVLERERLVAEDAPGLDVVAKAGDVDGGRVEPNRRRLHPDRIAFQNEIPSLLEIEVVGVLHRSFGTDHDLGKLELAPEHLGAVGALENLHFLERRELELLASAHLSRVAHESGGDGSGLERRRDRAELVRDTRAPLLEELAGKALSAVKDIGRQGPGTRDPGAPRRAAIAIGLKHLRRTASP